jgi:hypothetical protein
MAVRPFYIEANIEGRKTNLAGGTARKDGQHNIAIHQRDRGEITTPFKIEQSSFIEDGVHKLSTRVYYQGDLIKEHITDY